ncbi:putative protein TPRXL [Rosa chinensis]|uniref:putative protein TPRXL n=1 Tax=Rosa chinensis TaxID=74649 RepID=UPI001AD8A648|nr:putative protein TPRXL [Rosa chinensis]XP_040369072.1 putative protein TPRXL [Rosa chinensis]
MLFLNRFKTRDIPSTVLKGAPDFCTVYIIGREKISSVRSATGALPQKPKGLPSPCEQNVQHHQSERTQSPQCSLPNDTKLKSATILPASSNKQSLGRTFAFSDSMTAGMPPRHPTSSESDRSSTSTSYSGTEFIDMTYPQNEFSSSSTESGRLSTPQNMVGHFLCIGKL